MTERSLISSGGTRDRLVEAAERVLRTRGLAKATTKEIAREAGYAEGTLYLHFADKLDLVRAVHERLLPTFIEVVHRLPEQAGRGTVQGNLTELAASALDMYRDLMPLGSSLFADPELLRRFRGLLAAQGAGPRPRRRRRRPVRRRRAAARRLPPAGVRGAAQRTGEAPVPRPAPGGRATGGDPAHRAAAGATDRPRRPGAPSVSTAGACSTSTRTKERR
jgi:AcrR family transcriptional regulator